MTRNRLIQLGALGLALLALAAVLLMTPAIREERSELKLTLAAGRLDSLPPEIAVTNAALGSFRGLAINFMWYRANQLKQAGEYYEANQLSEWITTLQPQFAQAWAFHAWNMAYNISVATYTPEERWGWVQKGVNLLREKGVRYNPNAVRIYRELAWIFFHKIGRFSDDMHWHYKREFARKWHELLGAPNEGASAEEAIDRFRKVAGAPASARALVAEHPRAGAIIDRLQAFGYELDENLLRQLGGIRMVTGNTSWRLFEEDRRAFVRRFEYDPELVEIALAGEGVDAEALEALLAFLRRKVLQEAYNMDPGKMLAYMEAFGPFDWRNAVSHAFYWGALGTEKAMAARRQENIDALNTYRQNIHAIQMLTSWGRLGFDPVSGYLDPMPDPRFFPYYAKWMDKAKEEIQEGGFEQRIADTFDAGHENFLHRAITYSYLYGDPERAAEYYRRVRELYGRKRHNQREGRYRQPLNEFVMDLLQNDMQMMQQTAQFIDAMLVRAFERGLGQGRRDVFNHFIRLARRIHEDFNADKHANPNAPQQRMMLLPFDRLLLERYIGYMKLPSPRNTGRDGRRQFLLVRHRIWNQTPDSIRRPAYDRIYPDLAPRFREVGLDPERAIEKPGGLEDYRRRRAEQAEAQEAEAEASPVVTPERQ